MDKQVMAFNIFLSIFDKLQHTESAIEQTKLVMKELFHDG